MSPVDTAPAPETTGRARVRAVNRRLAAVGFGAVAASVALGLAVRSRVTSVDTWLHGVALHHRGFDPDILRTLTQAGSTKVVWPLVIVAALVFPRSRGWRRWATTAAFAGSAALAIGVRLELSLILTRSRPPAADWAGTASGFAYPSGHTTAATIGAGALGWAITRHLKHRWAQVAVWAAVVLYAGMVGWTRIWLGVHWPLDVVGGWLLGAGWLCAMAAYASWVERTPED